MIEVMVYKYNIRTEGCEKGLCFVWNCSRALCRIIPCFFFYLMVVMMVITKQHKN